MDLWAHRHAEDPELHNEVSMDEQDFEAELAALEAAAIAESGQVTAVGDVGDEADGFEDTYGGVA